MITTYLNAQLASSNPNHPRRISKIADL